MRAGSLLLFQPGRLIDLRVVFLLAAVLVLALLAYVVFVLGGSVPTQPESEQLLAPFRWEPLLRFAG